MGKTIIGFALLIMGTTVSCTSNEIGNSKDVNPDAVFFDYQVWSEDGKEEAVVKLQYRMGGPNGTTLVLNEPSQVKFDGDPIPVDSTKFDGAYYEVIRPLAEFAGEHQIEFTDLNKKTFLESFEFKPFSLDPDLPDSLSRSNMVFTFKGLADGSPLQVWLSDTVFSSNDYNEIDTVFGGKIMIPAEKLTELANGPVNLQFSTEIEKGLKNTTREGGRLVLRFGLRREFHLTGE